MQDLYCSSHLLNAMQPLPNPRVLIFEEIDSTNLEARRRFLEGDSGYTLLLANSQTAGRGRLGRSFHSPSAGIYLSLLAPIDPGELVPSIGVTCAASVAVIPAAATAPHIAIPEWTRVVVVMMVAIPAKVVVMVPGPVESAPTPPEVKTPA